MVKTKAKVIISIKKTLDKAKIDMPFETQIHLFHDQTEDRDGQPGQQREGWPMPANNNIQVRPRYKSQTVE